MPVQCREFDYLDRNAGDWLISYWIGWFKLQVTDRSGQTYVRTLLVGEMAHIIRHCAR
jgi:hypothetical protein